MHFSAVSPFDVQGRLTLKGEVLDLTVCIIVLVYRRMASTGRSSATGAMPLRLVLKNFELIGFGPIAVTWTFCVVRLLVVVTV